MPAWIAWYTDEDSAKRFAAISDMLATEQLTKEEGMELIRALPGFPPEFCFDGSHDLRILMKPPTAFSFAAKRRVE